MLASPLSFTGSAARLWALGTAPSNTAVRWALGVPAALALIGVAWMVVAGWYMATWFLLPLTVVYRLFRRSDRRHRELVMAIRRA